MKNLSVALNCFTRLISPMERVYSAPANEPSVAQDLFWVAQATVTSIGENTVSIRSPANKFAWRRGRLLLLLRGYPARKGMDHRTGFARSRTSLGGAVRDSFTANEKALALVPPLTQEVLQCVSTPLPA